MKDAQLLVNRIITPDGTGLISKHTHDYVTYIDKNGLEYMVDGGIDYLRRNIHKEQPFIEASLYSTDSIEELREYIYRGTRGEDGRQPLKYIKLKDIDDKWLKNIISYERKHRPNNVYLEVYKRERKYRRDIFKKKCEEVEISFKSLGGDDYVVYLDGEPVDISLEGTYRRQERHRRKIKGMFRDGYFD